MVSHLCSPLFLPNELDSKKEKSEGKCSTPSPSRCPRLHLDVRYSLQLSNNTSNVSSTYYVLRPLNQSFFVASSILTVAELAPTRSSVGLLLHQGNYA